MPRLGLEESLARLAKGQPIPAILLLGADVYLRDLARAKLVKAIVPEDARQWAVARFSALEVELAVVLQRAQTLPMLAPRQVIFLEDAEALEAGDDQTRKEVIEALSDYLDDPAPFTLLVFEAAQLDKRMKLAKLLNEKALVVATELAGEIEIRLPAATARAAQMAKDLGVGLDQDAAAELAEILDADLALMRLEIEKLAAYVGVRRRITTADVEAVVAPARKYSVWQLAEMLAERQRERALVFLDSVLREGEPAPAVIGALAWMIRKLLEAQELPRGIQKWEAARALNMRADTAERVALQARKFPRSRLLEGLRALYEADSRVKSGTRDHRAVLEFVIARLSARPESAAADRGAAGPS